MKKHITCLYFEIDILRLILRPQAASNLTRGGLGRLKKILESEMNSVIHEKTYAKKNWGPFLKLFLTLKLKRFRSFSGKCFRFFPETFPGKRAESFKF